VVDKVIETGQDPRRFTEDLLRRLRDLVIVAAVPDAPATGLIDAPEDQADRLVAQAARFGKTELVRAADCVAAGLTEMRGATTPRLLLELICARVLLPAADHTTDGLGARLDRLERRLDVAGGAPAPALPVAEVRAQRASRPPAADSLETPSAPPVVEVRAQRASKPPEPVQGPMSPEAGAGAPAPQPPAAAAPAALSLVDVRRIWPDLLEKVREMRRYTWILLSQNSQVIALEGNVLTVGFKNAGARDSFLGGGSEDVLRRAAIEVIGADWQVEAIVDPSADPTAGSAPRVTKPAVDAAPPVAAPSTPAPVVDPGKIAAARERIEPTRTGPAPAAGPESGRADRDVRDAEADRDDPEADAGLGGAELLERELGATVIDEIPHD
jgi:DNA polymerase-3 subunit gamma/tau